ncbi:MAG: DUF5666 domain-containing protein [Marinovum sp.]|nr:DUF5666 domain-containing protein [Marinovum sp.]
MTCKDLDRRHFLSRSLTWGGAGLLLPGLGHAQSSPRDIEGGIGGTGIVGILTDFGSLIVAGHKIETTSDTQYFNGFGQITENDVHRGHALTVEAQTQNGQLEARRVFVTYPLVGLILDISDGGRTLTVNGVDVILERRQSGLAPGQRVAVSGVWQGNRVIASALQPAEKTADLISGTVARGKTTSIAGVELQGAGVASLTDAGFGSVVGTYLAEQNRLIAQRVSNARFLGAAGPLQRLAIEGYVEPSNDAAGYRIAGLGHSFEPGPDFAQFGDKRVLFEGGYTGRFAVQAALILPSSPDPRRRLLRARGG